MEFAHRQIKWRQVNTPRLDCMLFPPTHPELLDPQIDGISDTHRHGEQEGDLEDLWSKRRGGREATSTEKERCAGGVL